MVVDGLVDNLDRDHDADVAVFDLVGVDELAAAVDVQLIVLDVEGAVDLLLENTGQSGKVDGWVVLAHSSRL